MLSLSFFFLIGGALCLVCSASLDFEGETRLPLLVLIFCWQSFLGSNIELF